MSIADWLRNRGYPDSPDFTVPVGPHACPECGTTTGVYVRSGDELVCTSCRDGSLPLLDGEFHITHKCGIGDES